MSNRKKIGFFQLIASYYLVYWKLWIGLLFFTICSCAITIAIPKLVNIIFSQLSMAANLNQELVMPWNILTYWAIGFVCAFVLSGLFTFIQNVIGGKIAAKIEIALRIKILNKLIDLDISYYEDKKMGNILTKLISDTRIIGEQTYQIPNTLLTAAFTFIGSIIVLFTLDNFIGSNNNTTWTNNISAQMKISSIVLGFSILVIILIVTLFKLFEKIIYKKLQIISEINGDASGRLAALKLIKISGTDDFEKQRFLRLHDDYYTAAIQSNKMQSLVMACLTTLTSALNVVVIIVGIIFVNNHQLNPVVLISYTMAVNAMVSPINQLLKILRRWANASVSAIRINELLSAKIKMAPVLNGMVANNIYQGISFQHVSFRYNDSGPEVIKDFTYHFEHNHSYALVGTTGVGKSTILNLLLKIYQPTSGSIMINNEINLANIDLKSYLKLIGYVEQDPQILYGSFLENVDYGTFTNDLTQIQKACEKAHLKAFIESLPDQYDTILGERGLKLSGGQKQRVVLARMFLKNPQLLILDEATSSLDNVVEKVIQAEIDELMHGRCSIIVAHRLSTIKNVDTILVLGPGGQILEEGSFEQLIEKHGKFRELYLAGQL